MIKRPEVRNTENLVAVIQVLLFTKPSDSGTFEEMLDRDFNGSARKFLNDRRSFAA